MPDESLEAERATVSQRLPRDFSMTTECHGSTTTVAVHMTFASSDEAKAFSEALNAVIIPLLALHESNAAAEDDTTN